MIKKINVNLKNKVQIKKIKNNKDIEQPKSIEKKDEYNKSKDKNLSNKINTFHDKKVEVKGKIDKSDICNQIYKKQIQWINLLFLNEEYDEKNEIEREINRKISSYKKQDEKMKRYEKNTFILFDEVVEKLVASKLTCHYCYTKLWLVNYKKREASQWTLDRIDNEIQHSCDNCVVSCYKCNIKRGRIDKDKFLFTKQMRLIKKN